MEALISTIYNPPRASRPWRLQEVLPDGVTRYYSLGRWALLHALRACGVGPGDTVLVPGLICRDVLASINALGAHPVFYPVTRQLRAALGADTAPPARAVLAVNYFGFPQDLGIFRSYCAHTGAALVEDNAHGLFSRDTDGRLLGSRGDAAVFSFRKTIAVPDGAALVLNGGRTIVESTAPESVPVPMRYRVKQAFRRVASAAGPRRTSAIIDGVRRLRQVTTGHAVTPGSPDAEVRIPGPPQPTALIGGPITVADPEAEGRRRRQLYEIAAGIAERAGGSLVFPVLPPNVVPYGLPMSVAPACLDRLSAEVRGHGLQLVSWPDLPGAVAQGAPDHYRQLMVMPFLW